MSDCAAKRFSNKEEFQTLSSQSDLGKSSYLKHSLWMAHWTRASSSAEPRSGKSCGPLEEISDVGYLKDCGTSPFELKSRVAERLMLGVSNAGASAGNTQQFSSKTWGVTHNVFQGMECKNIDQVDRSFNSTMMQKNVNLYAADTVVSERFSVHKISDISVNSSHKVLSSENLNSEWNHFPMFEINQKIDSILNPRRAAFITSPDKPFVSQRALKVNMSTSNVMAFSSKEYEFHSHRVTDDNKSKCKSAGGFRSHDDNHIGLSSDHVGTKLKGHSIEESSSCSKNEFNSSGSLRDKESEINFIVNSKGLPHCSENKFMLSASRKENEDVQGSLREKRLGASGGKQPDYERVASHHQVLSSEDLMKSVNPPSRSEMNAVETNHCGPCGIISANILQCERENLTINRVDSAMKLTQSCKLPDTTENTVAVKSNGATQAGGKPPNDKLKNGKKKAPCLFEMLTVPSESHTTCFRDLISLGRTCGDMSSSLLEAQKQSSTKSDILNMRHTPGFAGTSTQKEFDGPKMEQTSTSSIRRASSCIGGNEAFNFSGQNHNSFSKATYASKQEWSRSKTSSMNLDLVLFKISRLRNPISSALIESPVCSEPSDKWLKRLRHDVSESDPYFLCSKRSRFGDDPSRGGTCTVFGQELGRDIGKTGMISHVKEDQPGYGRLINQQNQEISPISSKSLNRWIGRWCQGGTPLFHATSKVEKQTPKSNMQPYDLEGQFPSIAAMAMMGRVMNKLRPRELERRGPSLVWKTQGL